MYMAASLEGYFPSAAESDYSSADKVLPNTGPAANKFRPTQILSWPL